MGETETVFARSRTSHAALIQDDMRPTVTTAANGLWPLLMEFTNANREACTTLYACLQATFKRPTPVCNFEHVELASTATSVRNIGRQSATREQLASFSMYMFISPAQRKALMATGTLRCPSNAEEHCDWLTFDSYALRAYSMHIYRSSKGRYNDVINDQLLIISNPTRGRTEADLLSDGPTAASKLDQTGMRTVAYNVRRFIVSEPKGITILHFFVNMNRWMPSTQDYAAHFTDELSKGRLRTI